MNKITGSQQLMENIETAVERFIEDLGDIMYHAGYSVEGGYDSANKSIDISVTSTDSQPAMMPTIYFTFDTLEEETNEWFVIPELSFPMLTFTPYEDYADTIHYWLGKWENVGSYITRINKYTFDAEEFIEIYLDEEE